MDNEKHESTEREVPTVQEQREFLALWEKLNPAQRSTVKALLQAILDE